MKLARILMLGLGLAIFAGAASAEPAVAQCWDCIQGPGDDEHSYCEYCSNGQWGLGVESCATPACQDCDLSGYVCEVYMMLDGRVAPKGPPESPLLGAPGEAIGLPAFSASNASAGPVSTPSDFHETTRSCDGEIISRWYSASEVLARRSATSKLMI